MTIFVFKKYIKYVFFICFLISTTSFANKNSILLFVSLGMPDNALKSYLLQAKQYHIPVVIRGLYTDNNDLSADKTVGSFNDTANRIFNLLKSQETAQDHQKNINTLQKTMGGVSINPLLFRSFGINVVPALVVTNNSNCIAVNHQPNSNEHCSTSDFDVVFGNIPIQKQLNIIAEKSDNKMRVTLAVNRLRQYEPNQQKQFE